MPTLQSLTKKKNNIFLHVCFPNFVQIYKLLHVFHIHHLCSINYQNYCNYSTTNTVRFAMLYYTSCAHDNNVISKSYIFSSTRSHSLFRIGLSLS